MKTLKLILFLLFALIIKVSCNYNDQPQIKENIIYPDLISPIYYIDTFQISAPRIAIIDSLPYIFSFNNNVSFSNKEDFINHKGLIRFLTPELHFFRTINFIKIHEHKNWERTFQDLAIQNEFYFEELFLKDDSLFGIPTFRFAFEPQTFLLTLIAHIDSMDTAMGHEDSIFEIFFSKNYKLALAPIYNKQDLKKINKLWINKLKDSEKY